MKIRIAKSDQQIAACYPVIQALRPHISEESFVRRVRGLEKAGYMLAFAEEAGRPVAVAGFRIAENLSWGRFLYVDDLVTLSTRRSHGFGAGLVGWLTGYAAANGCSQLHLDSGTQRKDAHRFYEREGIRMTGYHFAKQISPHPAT